MQKIKNYLMKLLLKLAIPVKGMRLLTMHTITTSCYFKALLVDHR